MPLLDYRWKSASDHAPDWDRWLALAGHDGQPPAIAQSFSEETHAIDAAVAGQGAVLAPECLVAGLLADGTLTRLSDIALPGLATDIGLPEDCAPDQRENVFGFGPHRGQGFRSQPAR